MTSEEREYFTSRKSLCERLRDHYREYEEELEHERIEIRGYGNFQVSFCAAIYRKELKKL